MPACELTTEEIERIRRQDNETWHITERVSKEHGVQKIVDCAEDGDVLLIDVSLRIQPNHRIIIHRDLTIDRAPASSENVAVEGAVEFNCPPQEGLFFVM